MSLPSQQNRNPPKRKEQQEEERRNASVEPFSLRDAANNWKSKAENVRSHAECMTIA